MSYRILIADDDPLICVFFRKVFRSQPWEVEVVEGGPEALDRVYRGSFDVAVLDIYMPQVDGLEILQTVQQRGIRTDVVLMTGQGTIEVAVQAMKEGARDFLCKPIKSSAVVETIRELLEQRHPLPPALARRLDGFVKEHAGEAALSLAELSRHFRISERYTCRLFQENYGATYRQRLCHYRVERAKHLLAATDMSMRRIAETCGFKNQRRFSEAFCRQEGMPPRKYQENVFH